MKTLAPIRVAKLVIAALMLTQVVSAQSGRSWTKGFVFADSDTKGLSGATIELLGDPDNERLRVVKLSAKTEQDGQYSIAEIPYGEYTFRVTTEGYEPYQIKLYIGSDMLTQIHVKLKRKR